MFLKLYLIAFVVFFVIDIIWLSLIAKDLYARYLGYLMAENVRWVAAIVFYLLFIAGLVVFVIQPAVLSGSWSEALLRGFFFGLVTYATYDLTNLATVRDWPLLITAVDLVWGTFLGGSVSLITFFVSRLF
jgi:uncharacterized membrane protein